MFKIVFFFPSDKTMLIVKFICYTLALCCLNVEFRQLLDNQRAVCCTGMIRARPLTSVQISELSVKFLKFLGHTNCTFQIS